MDPEISRYKLVFDTIPNGLSVSVNGIGIPGWSVVGLVIPGTIDALNFSFEVDPGDGTFRTVTIYSFVAPAINTIIMLGAGATGGSYPAGLIGARIRVKASGNVAADRKMGLMMVPA